MEKVLVFVLLLLMSIFVVGCNFTGGNPDGGNPGGGEEENPDGGNSGGGNGGADDNTPVTYETYGSYWLKQSNYKVMPVGVYNALPPQLEDFTHNYLASAQTYIDYKAAGINMLQGLYEYANNSQYRDLVLKALDYCSQNELSYLIAYSGAHNVRSTSGPNSALNRIKYHDALGGLMLSDEPGYKMLEDLKIARGIFESVMPDDKKDILWHTNLFPTYANKYQLYYRTQPSNVSDFPAGGYTYSQYIDDYVRIYKPQVLSYDNYPIMSGSYPGLGSDYFENMSIIRAKALEVNIPFWVFVQTCSFQIGQRLPSQSEMNWLVNTSLTYGSKGIQYFTGVLPTNAHGGEQFTGAMFDRDGNKTDIYTYVQNTNKQVAAVDEVLMQSISKGLIQVGTSPSSIPNGDKIAAYKELTSAVANHSLIGCFDYKGKPAYYITNNAIALNDTDNSDTVVLNFSKSISGYTIKNAQKASVSGNSLSIDLPAGGGVLLVLE